MSGQREGTVRLEDGATKVIVGDTGAPGIPWIATWDNTHVIKGPAGWKHRAWLFEIGEHEFPFRTGTMSGVSGSDDGDMGEAIEEVEPDAPYWRGPAFLHVPDVRDVLASYISDQRFVEGCDLDDFAEAMNITKPSRAIEQFEKTKAASAMVLAVLGEDYDAWCEAFENEGRF